MKTEHQRTSGFTLIETILYVGIITIVFGAVVPFAWNIIEGSAKSSTQREVRDNAKLIAETIRYEIRRASGIGLVAVNSMTLTNFAPDTVTVIDLVGGKVRINKNGLGVVNLNSEGTTVTDFTLVSNTSLDGKTKNISFTLMVEASGSRQEYRSSISLRGAAEVKSN